MATIRIKNIGRRDILKDEDYRFICDNINEPLRIMSINYDREGNVWSIAVYKGDSDCVSLFVDTNALEYEIDNEINKAIDTLIERKDIIKNIHNFDKQAYLQGLMDGRMEEIGILISILKGLSK